MNPEDGVSAKDWLMIWRRLADEGWELVRQRDYRPMFGRYWSVRAAHRESGRCCVAEGPTLKIALKKIEAASVREGDV